MDMYSSSVACNNVQHSRDKSALLLERLNRSIPRYMVDHQDILDSNFVPWGLDTPLVL